MLQEFLGSALCLHFGSSVGSPKHLSKNMDYKVGLECMTQHCKETITYIINWEIGREQNDHPIFFVYIVNRHKRI